MPRFAMYLKDPNQHTEFSKVIGNFERQHKIRFCVSDNGSVWRDDITKSEANQLTESLKDINVMLHDYNKR